MLFGEFSFVYTASLKIKFRPLEVKMELTVIYQCVAALDVHQAKLTVCMLYVNEAGEVITKLKEFGGFKKDRRAMAKWVASFHPDVVVMESTGVYWKSPYAALEKHGLKIDVVNARYVNSWPKNGYSRCPMASDFSSKWIVARRFRPHCAISRAALNIPADAKTRRNIIQ